MPTVVRAAADRAERRVLAFDPDDLQAASSQDPPSPGQMLTRLGALLVIALGFGLIAQHLVGSGL